eukprot:Tamp_02691.p1 GENE.Tamp_02691~~Tamp_02691.p1  ORF type:complete len:1064 (+),score=248.41 Tamp_02691:470-3661(+)
MSNDELAAALLQAKTEQDDGRGQTLKTLDDEAVHQYQLSEAAWWDSYIKVGDMFFRPCWQGYGSDLRELDLSDKDMTGLDLRGARLQGANLAGTILAGCDCREASFGNAVLSEGHKDPTVPGLEWEINDNIVQHWGPGAGTEIKNEALAAALKEFCADKKGKGSTKFFTKDEIVGFQVAELRVNSYIIMGKKFCEDSKKVIDFACQPAAQEITSAWSEWEKGKNGSKATRVAQMTGALVSGSDFEGASMSGVNMLLVNGRYANLQKTLQHAANFRHATLPNADFRGAMLPKADFRDSTLPNARFEGATLPNAIFWRATLPNAYFQLATLPNAHFGDSTLTNANFSGATLPNAIFWRATLPNAYFQRATLPNADFRESTVDETNFSSVHLEEADFTEAKMRNVILNEAFLNGAKMTKVDLTDAQVQNADFSPETGTAKYKNVDLEGSNLTGADFSNSNVEGVDADGATVVGTIWDGARNLKPQNSMTMGISKNSGTACTFAPFKLPARKVKTETLFKHTTAIFESMIGGDGDDSDSGGSGGDSDDNPGEESEDEDEDDEEEKTGLLSKIADGVQDVVSQLGKITTEVHPFYTKKSKELKAGALAADKVVQEVESIKGRARTLDTQSAVAQVLHKALADLAGDVFDQMCKNVQSFIDKAPEGESGNDVEAGTGIDALKNDFCQLVMSKVKDKVEEATKQIKSRTSKVSGPTKAVHVLIGSLCTKVAPRIAKTIVRTPEQTPNLELISAEIEESLATFEKILFEDGIGGMANGIIADQIQKKLGKFAAGISQKMALISKYEKAVTSRTTEDLSAERMAKLSSKISSRAIADVMNQSTKYELPTGYMKQVRMIHLAFERSTAKLMRDAKEIEYVLEKLKALEAGGFAKETWKDSLASWIAFFDLYKQVNVQCALAVFECMAADPAVVEAVGAAKPFIELDGELPAAIMVKLTKGPADHIRKNAYKYAKLLARDLSMITRIQETQARIIALIGAAITAALVSVGNFIARLGFKAYEEGKEVSVMTVIIVLSSVVGCLFLIWALSRSWSAYRSMTTRGGAYSRVRQTTG